MTYTELEAAFKRADRVGSLYGEGHILSIFLSKDGKTRAVLELDNGKLHIVPCRGIERVKQQYA